MTSARFINVVLVNLKLCLLEIYSNKTRSLISTLGIFIGTVSLLINLTFIRGMEKDMAEHIERIGGVRIITIKDRHPETDEEMLAFQRSSGLSIEEMESIAELVDGIERLLPMEDMHWERFRAEGKSSGARTRAVSIAHNAVYNFPIQLGSDFTQEQFLRLKPVCIVGETVAMNLFGSVRGALNKKVVLRNHTFTVIGIFESQGRFDWRSRMVHFPYPYYKTYFKRPNRVVDEIAILVRSADQIPSVSQVIERELLRRHRQVRDFEIELNTDKIKELQTASAGMGILITSIAIISLTVGAVSIMNTMFGTIGDRIREIGLRKALGAHRIDIFAQFLIEALLLSFIGGLPGLLIGWTFTQFPEGTFPFTPLLRVSDYILTVFFICGAGVFSGVFPAFRAAFLEPVDALRW